ncbi:hypothetical protein B5C34_12875 [Pacificimonas flava]|uniref:DUF2721 domain-containing protein n=2 Tax=Pacificimonas TaxID=1960290 RepID=A0A219B792_9SPHN|nr:MULTISPECIES: DUF2721 domain-containing protein [Pacificimonas]MBZ6378438.1 DUF2721 domain-containing protein [Pacificimonas aurantium]OWV34262.1 hypothetical protein B5C34_12875 [Pacificimonas flava]
MGIPVVSPILGSVAETTANVAARTADTASLAHTLELALAPAFLIVGIGSLLNVLTSRLGRVVDRARRIEAEFESYDERRRSIAAEELPYLERRTGLINTAIFCSVAAALCVALTVAILFVAPFVPPRLGTAVALLFVLAMILIVFGLVAFLLETRTAQKGLRARRTASALPPTGPRL